MDVVYGLIPMMLLFGALVVAVFIWMAKTGHFDDLDGAAHSIFMDDDVPAPKADPNKEPQSKALNNSETKSSNEQTPPKA
jgi:cbb3-type cytochrome oxidase maturation protein